MNRECLIINKELVCFENVELFQYLHDNGAESRQKRVVRLMQIGLLARKMRDGVLPVSHVMTEIDTSKRPPQSQDGNIQSLNETLRINVRVWKDEAALLFEYLNAAQHKRRCVRAVQLMEIGLLLLNSRVLPPWVAAPILSMVEEIALLPTTKKPSKRHSCSGNVASETKPVVPSNSISTQLPPMPSEVELKQYDDMRSEDSGVAGLNSFSLDD